MDRSDIVYPNLDMYKDFFLSEDHKKEIGKNFNMKSQQSYFNESGNKKTVRFISDMDKFLNIVYDKMNIIDRQIEYGDDDGDEIIINTTNIIDENDGVYKYKFLPGVNQNIFSIIRWPDINQNVSFTCDGDIIIVYTY